MRTRGRGGRSQYTVMLPSGLDVHTAMVIFDREVTRLRLPACTCSYVFFEVEWALPAVVLHSLHRLSGVVVDACLT